MYFDLNVHVPGSGRLAELSQSKKGKGKQPQKSNSVTYSAAQITVIEARIDLLVHLGYTVIAFNQVVHKKVDQKTHVNVLNPLLAQLRKRAGVVVLKRLTIILDDESEKGTGLTNANASLLSQYDVIAVVPTTPATFSQACLTLSLPSQQTSHIIALPLTLPRLPFLKHTLIRTAIKNGAVFEISYVGAFGGEADPVLGDAGAAEMGVNAKRNWWAAARELTRVTKGKGIVVSGGVVNDADLRAPRDVGNLITLLGLAQNIAHDALTTRPKSLILRAQTRKTYRAVLSEPKLVIPSADGGTTQQREDHDLQKGPEAPGHDPVHSYQPSPHRPQPASPPPPPSTDEAGPHATRESKKRPRGDDDVEVAMVSTSIREGSAKKKKKRGGRRESEQA